MKKYPIKYRIELRNIEDKLCGIVHCDTLKEAEEIGFRHQYLETYSTSRLQPKHRLFTIWQTDTIK